jgi:hypothetical protein
MRVGARPVSRRPARAAFLAAAALAVIPAGCGGDAPGARADQAAEGNRGAAPWGLPDVVPPEEPTDVKALFGRLASEVSGLARSRPADRGFGFIDVTYGSAPTAPIVLRAARLDVPPWGSTRLTPLDHLRILRRGDRAPEATQLDPDARLVYLISSTVEMSVSERRVLYTATWARPNGRWLFIALAESPELRAAAVEAFVAAAHRRDRS